jgi:multidrug efflux pump
MVGREVVVGGVVASFWVKLASAIVYGLTFSTVLTLVVTPVMLVLPGRVRELFAGLLPPRIRGAQWGEG